MSALRCIQTSRYSGTIAFGVVVALVLTAFLFPPLVTASDPPVASSITLSDVKDPIYVGESAGLTVSVLDQYGAVFTAYDGTVTFSSTDHSAILPASYTFTPTDAGVHTFSNDSLTFNTVGEQMLNVTDIASAIGLTLGTITVMPLDVTPHGPIRILSDSEFNSSNGVISGNGTSSDPYLIANLQLDINTPDGGIEIHNTTSCFVIQHVRIANDRQWTAQAVRLDSVKNGAVRDVEVTSAERIVTLNHCENIEVDNVTTTFDGSWAFVANDSSNVTVSRLYFEQMLDGVEMFGCDNSTISNNTIYTADYGIYLVGCKNVQVTGNEILSNNHGVTLKSSTGVVILNNNILGSWTWPGFDDSPGLNQWDGGYPACGNYWARYTGSDENCGPLQVVPGSDGIGDTPYDTGYGAVDDYPLMTPWVGHLDLPPVHATLMHAPISISGDGDFTPQNGVSSGNGTPLNPYIIEGWDIDSGGDIGIAVRGTNAYFVIRNTTIHSNVSGWQIGIYFNSVKNCVLEYNNCTGQLYGMQLQYCTNISIYNNTCMLDGVGIWVEASLNSSIGYNLLSNNSDSGVFVYQSTETRIFHNNCSLDLGAGIQCDSRGLTVIEHNICINDSIGIGVIGPSICTVEENTLVQNSGGMQLFDASGTIVRNNSFNSNGDSSALTIWNSNRVVASGNSFTNESMAINVDSSYYCVLENNTCIGGTGADIGVYFCSGNRIENNTLRDGAGEGIILQYADGNMICHNLISGKGGYAVDLYEACSHNKIWNNTFTGTMKSGTSYDPLRPQGNDNGTDNYWNSSGAPHGYGNYWSDWTQPDLDNDGIVDNPYAMNGSAGAFDNYPLVNVTYVDLEPPVTVDSISGTLGANGYYVSNVTICLNPTDDRSGVLATYWKIEGGQWEEYTGPFILAGGAWSVSFYSTDKSGNAELAKNITVRVDPLPPITSLEVVGSLGDQGWYVSEVNISTVVTLPSGCVLNSTYCRIGAGDWQSNVTIIDLSADGPTTVYYYSDDMAGNAEQVKSLALKIDRTTPTMSLSMADGTILDTQTAVVAWTSIDSMSGVNHFEVRLDGLLVSSPNTTQAWIQLSNLALGSHNLTVSALDNAGNLAEVNVSFEVQPVAVPEFGDVPLPIILIIGILIAVNLFRRKR